MEEKPPFLSVVVPAFNVADYIGKCIDSIIKQSFEDFELIVVDDGSSDSTGEICDNYALIDKRVRVIHKKNGGLVSSRKAGVVEAKGKYISYVDGDDWIAYEMFETLCDSAINFDADIVISDFAYVYNSGIENKTQNMREGKYIKKDLYDEFYPNMLCKGAYFSFGVEPSLCSKIIRRDILLKNQLEVNNEIALGEDAACSYRCYLEAKTIYYVKNHFFYYYRMRETSISHSIHKSFYTQDVITLIEQLHNSFSIDKSLWTQLEPQLWLYACYMIDNMITPHINFRELFWDSQVQKQLQVIANWQKAQDMIKCCDLVHTSSRMKRIIKCIQNPCIKTKINLYAFTMYEKFYGSKKHEKKNQ